MKNDKNDWIKALVNKEKMFNNEEIRIIIQISNSIK